MPALLTRMSIPPSVSATVPNARCTACAACSKICLDVLPRRSAELLTVRNDPRELWTLSPFGAFAAAFPGFITAYAVTPSLPIADGVQIYGFAGLCAALSWLALSAVFRIGGVGREVGLLWCAALAAGVYYWFTPVGVVREFGLPASTTWPLRALTMTLVAVWLVRGLPRDRRGAAIIDR